MKPKQECHGARRRLHSRALLGSLVLASASLSACGDDHGEDSAELQAILHDGDLTQVMRSMLMTPPPRRAGTGTAGTDGGMAARQRARARARPGTRQRPGRASRARRRGRARHGHRGRGPGTGGTGGPGPTRSFPGQAQGFWRFDDCNMDRTELCDSTFFGNHTAFRSVTAFCRPGVLNTGIGFDEDDDLVIVPDQPNFVFSEGFTVAAWVKPMALGGVRTIFRKRQDGTSTFVLVENGKNFQIVISLANGKAADVQAPATLDKFTHVAATYDGIFLKLYLDGMEAASKRVVGRLSDGVGPLLMGNDANLRRIDGIIDNVVFDTVPATPAEIAKLTCLPQPSVMSVTPVDPAAVPPGTPVSYDVQITNNSCEDASFNFNAFPFNFNPDIIVSPSFGNAFVPAASTAHLPFAVSASPDIEEFGTSQIFVNAQLFVVQLRVVQPDRELLGPRQLDGVHGQAPAGARNPRRQRRRRSGPHRPGRRVDVRQAHGEHGTDAGRRARDGRGDALVVPQPADGQQLHAPPALRRPAGSGQHAGPGREARSLAAGVPPARDRQPHRPHTTSRRPRPARVASCSASRRSARRCRRR